MAASQRERSPSFPFLILGLGIAAGVTGLMHGLGTGLSSQALALVGFLLAGAGVTLRRETQGEFATPRHGWPGFSAWLLGSGAALAAGWGWVSFGLLLRAFWALGAPEGTLGTSGSPRSLPARLRVLWVERGGLFLGWSTLFLLLHVAQLLTRPGGAKAHLLELGLAGLLLSLLGIAWAGRTDGLRVLAPGIVAALHQNAGSPLRVALAGMVPFAAFLILAYLVRLPQVARFDVAFIHQVYQSGGDTLTRGLKALSGAGGRDLALYWVPAIAVALAFTRRAAAVRFFLILNLSVFGIETVFKTLTHRQRPDFTHGLHFDSFPSGHTLSAVLLAGVLVLILWPQRRGLGRWLLGFAAVAWPVSMAAARVYLGRHYLTDVVGSLLLGTAWLLWCLALLLLTAPKTDLEPR